VPSAIGQSVLLLLMALPVHNALVTPANEHKSTLLSLPLGLHLSDLALAALTIIDIYLQWIADNQQYSYQTYKHALKASPADTKAIQTHSAWQHGSSRLEWTPRDIKRGFVTRGLFSWSRHPNFACEQVMWLLQGSFPLLSGQPSELTKTRWLVIYHPLITPFAVSLFQRQSGGWPLIVL
jgi:steroid 5-alpha reductase family enzyme